MLWSFLGFLSSIVGLVCFALSSSYKHLFGDWNRLKLLLYIIASLITCNIVLFAKKIQVSRNFIVKSHVGFLVLMLTSLFSYFYDKSMNGKPDTFSIISYAAFASMSLCFSRKMEIGFEVGLFNFFLGFLAVQLMKISLVLAFVAALFCYSLIVFRCYLDSQLEIGNGGADDEEDSVKIEIDDVNGVEPETAARSEGVNEEVPKLEIGNGVHVDEEDSTDSVIHTAATHNESVHQEAPCFQASSGSSVGGESEYEENHQNMKEERVLVNETHSFSSEIHSFSQNRDTGLRRRNKGIEEEWKCSSCNSDNFGRSEPCKQCGQFKSVSSPCAACKFLRRRCAEGCVFAPYFPRDDPDKFAIVHKVFGASNVNKHLQELPVHQRGDAVSSLVYEANARVRDPVYGCVGAISYLQSQVSQLQMQLAMAQKEILCIQMQQEPTNAPIPTDHYQEDSKSMNILSDNNYDISSVNPFHYQYLSFASSSSSSSSNNVLQDTLKRESFWT